MGITIFKIFICGGFSSDISLKSLFTADISDRISKDIPLQMKIFNTVISYILCVCSFVFYFCHSVFPADKLLRRNFLASLPVLGKWPS